MKPTPTTLLLSLAAASAYALSGTVKDAKGVAVAGASLHLVSQPSTTVSSNAAGEFALAGPTSIGRSPRPDLARVEREGRRLVLRFEDARSAGPVHLVSRDGKRGPALEASELSGAVRRYDLPRLAPGLYLVQVGNERPATAAMLVSTGTEFLLGGEVLGGSSFAARAAATVDTLVATKTGFVPSRTPVSSYDQTGLAVVLKSASDTGSPLPPITDYSLNGPYNTVVEANVGPGGKYTVIRPEPLGANGFLHAPLVYGPGISTPVSSSTNFLKIIASHGFVIVGCNMLTGGPNDAGNNTTMRNGLSWIVEQNTTAGSKYQGKIAVTKGVTMGYSVGGTAAVDIADHPAVATTVSIHGHISKTKLHGPLLQTSGTKDNVGLPMQKQTFTNSNVQTFLGIVTNADHGYIMQNNGGVQRPAIVAWLRYWIYNDQGGKKYFYGTDCVMCKSPWENPQRKNWP